MDSEDSDYSSGQFSDENEYSEEEITLPEDKIESIVISIVANDIKDILDVDNHFLPFIHKGHNEPDKKGREEILELLEVLSSEVENGNLEPFASVVDLKAKLLTLKDYAQKDPSWKLQMCSSYFQDLDEEYPALKLHFLERLLFEVQSDKDVKTIVEFVQDLLHNENGCSDDVLNFCFRTTKNSSNYAANYDDLLLQQLGGDKSFSNLLTELKTENEYIPLDVEPILRSVLKNLGTSDFIEDPLVNYLVKASNVTYKLWGYYPRKAQLLAVILMINNQKVSTQEINGNLYEIKTGEGKSLIVAIMAGYLVTVKKQPVDVFTSNEELAKSGAKEMTKFFELVGDVSCKAIDTGFGKKYDADVIYGSPNAFIFDILRDETREDKIRPTNRPFSYLIMDEADKIIIDDFNYLYMISQTMRGSHHLELLFWMIWSQNYNFKEVSVHGKTFMTNGLCSIWSALLQAFGVCESFSYDNLTAYAMNKGIVEDVENQDDEPSPEKIEEFETRLLHQMTKDKVVQFLQHLSEDEIIDLENITLYFEEENGKITRSGNGKSCFYVNAKGQACFLVRREDFEEKLYEMLKDMIKFDTKDDEDDKFSFPRSMKKVIESNLKSYIQSAIRATELKEDCDYIVSDGRIRIINKDTGEISQGTRWSDGLHEMIEIKHNLMMDNNNINDTWTKIFRYVLQYHGNVFGLTGTLAIKSDGKMLTDVFKMKLWKIPTFRPVIRKELLPIVFNSADEDWLECVALETIRIAGHDRAVLIIGETIGNCKLIVDKLKEINSDKIKMLKMYFNNEQENHVNSIQKKMAPGSVIVASNLGGRGTDFQLEPEVLRNGGLHVILTFFPRNQRIESQAFGRAGRKGQMGTSQLIINQRHCSWYQNMDIYEMRDKRKRNFLNTLQSRASEVEKDIKWRDLLDYWKSKIEDCSRDEKSLLNEQFAIWRQSANESSSLEKLKGLVDNLYDSLKKAWNQGIINEDVQFISSYFLLNFNASTKENEEKLINLAINVDPDWAMLPHYRLAIMKAERSDLNGAKASMQESQKCLYVHLKEVEGLMGFVKSLSNVSQGEVKKSKHMEKLEARESVLGELLKNISNNIDELQKIIDGNLGCKLKHDDVHSLIASSERSSLENDELDQIVSCGLPKTIKVEEKKPFCWSAFWCTVLGALEILGGIAIIVLSCGALTSMGVNFISEGISDVADGIKGMVSGTFSWVQWAIAKAISLAVSLVCFGFSKMMKYGKGCVSAVKSSCKKGMSILKGTGAAVKSASKGTLAKTACKVVVKKGVEHLVSEGINLLVSAAFKAVMKTIFENVKIKVDKKFQNSLYNGRLHDSGFSSQKIMEAFAIVGASVDEPTLFERREIKNFMKNEGRTTVDNILRDAGQIYDKLYTAFEHIVNVTQKIHGNMKSNGHATVAAIMKTTEITTMIISAEVAVVNALDSITSIEDKMAQTVKKEVDTSESKLIQNQNEYLQALADGCSEVFTDHLKIILERGVEQHVKGKVSSAINKPVSKFVSKKLGTQNDVKNMKAIGERHMATNGYISKGSVSEEVFREYEKWLASLDDKDYPGDVLKLRAYSDSFKKKVKIFQDDKNGKRECKERVGNQHPGEAVNLLYHPPSDENGTGHYELLDKDKNVVKTSSSGEKTCIDDALAKAESKSPQDIRDKIKNHVKSQPNKYQNLVKRKVNAKRYGQKYGDNFFMQGGDKKAFDKGKSLPIRDRNDAIRIQQLYFPNVPLQDINEALNDLAKKSERDFLEKYVANDHKDKAKESHYRIHYIKAHDAFSISYPDVNGNAGTDRALFKRDKKSGEYRLYGIMNDHNYDNATSNLSNFRDHKLHRVDGKLHLKKKK